MKKILVSMLVIVPLLCGCTNINTTLTLNKDKSATVSTVLNYEGDVLEKGSFSAETIQNNYKKFLDDDYKVEVTNKKDGSQRTVCFVIPCTGCSLRIRARRWCLCQGRGRSGRPFRKEWPCSGPCSP